MRRGTIQRLAAGCLALAVLALAPPALGQTAPAEKPNGPAHAYLLHGFMNVFSLGLDPLAEKLQRRGIRATLHNHAEWDTLAEQAIAGCKSGREGSIILIGHSLGAVAVLSMAERLGQAHVKVALVATLDPVRRTTVPGNVSLLANYYLSDGMGVPVARGASFHGTLKNDDMKGRPEIGHVSLVSSDAVQRQIIGYAVAAAHSPCS
jgi:pimeloyl-ACP methyl ester carboxylesterase